MSRDQTILRALTECEEACRRWCAEAVRATAMFAASAEPSRWRDSVLDASYMAAATARVLARRDDVDWGATTMLVSACEQIAARSATSWRPMGSGRLRDCVAAAEACARACALLLSTLLPAPRRTDEFAAVDLDDVGVASTALQELA